MDKNLHDARSWTTARWYFMIWFAIVGAAMWILLYIWPVVLVVAVIFWLANRHENSIETSKK